MGSAVHEYTYSVQVKSRFDLFAKDEYNVEDSSMAVKSREKRDRHTSGKVKSEVPDKIDTKESGSQKERRGASQKPEQRATESSKKDHAQRGKGGFTQGRMDRHSGSDKTGIKAVMKKDGYGTGNWGTIEDELEAQTAEVDIEEAAEEKAPSEKNEPLESVEEQPKTLTLKEYREMKKKPKVVLATKGTRSPNDGQNVFSNMVEVHKSKPVETKVEVVLDYSKPDEPKPNFFEFGRGGSSGRPFPRNSTRGGRGRAGVPRNEPSEQETTKQEPDIEPQVADPPVEASTEKEATQMTTERRGRGGRDRPFRGRGRGGPPRISFSSERGASRGRGAPVGDRPLRGAERGGNRGGPRAPRGGFTGGRGRRGAGPEGAPRTFRGGRGRGGFDQPQEGSTASNRGFRGSQPRSAPQMDSDADFPALK